MKRRRAPDCQDVSCRRRANTVVQVLQGRGERTTSVVWRLCDECAAREVSRFAGTGVRLRARLVLN